MPEVLLKQDEAQRMGFVSSGLLATHGARVFAAGGAILLIGALLDLFALWVLQRQSTVQWEFVALGTTTNSYPVLVISAALFYGALALKGSESLAGYRLAATYVVLLGLMGLTVGFLIGTNYLAVRRGANITAEAAPVFRGLLVKSGGTSLLFGLVMLVAGLLGFRRPRSRMSRN
jgi:hypothetical protein